MKLFETLATHFGMKIRILSTLGSLALAGAALTAATPAAQAQVSFGFGINTAPRYYAPRPVIVAPPRPVYAAPYGYARPYGYGYGPEGYWAPRHEAWRDRGWHGREWNRGPGYGYRPY